MNKKLDCPTNVVIYNTSKPASFYVFLAKEMFFNEKHKEIELHGVGDINIRNLAVSIEMITRFGYAEITRIKTEQVV